MFSQAANVDRLLTMLRTLDPAKDNLADNEEIQELYRSCMTLRPKIVKLIDKYSQKRGMLSLRIKRGPHGSNDRVSLLHSRPYLNERKFRQSAHDIRPHDGREHPTS